MIGAGARNEFREEDQMGCAWVAEKLVESGHHPSDAPHDGDDRAVEWASPPWPAIQATALSISVEQGNSAIVTSSCRTSTISTQSVGSSTTRSAQMRRADLAALGPSAVAIMSPCPVSPRAATTWL